MIEWWQALVLALIQGLTEFLPISSSAHLLFPSLLLGWPDQGLAFDVAVHVGTLFAVVMYFRRELLDLLSGLLQGVAARQMNPACMDVVFLAIASAPIVVAGLLLSGSVDALRRIPVIIAATVFFALVLAWADRRATVATEQRVSGWLAALTIGAAQVLALIPGTSRSGITITAGLFLGLTREAASRFAFLLSIPVIAGAGLLKGIELLNSSESVEWFVLTLGVVVAWLSAYLCIALFLRLVNRVGMMPFVVYRLLLGGLLLAFWWR